MTHSLGARPIIGVVLAFLVFVGAVVAIRRVRGLVE